MPLLGEQKTSETLLPSLVLTQLQVHDGPALVASHPDGRDAGELGESIGEVVQLVAHQVQNGEFGEGVNFRGKFHQVIITNGEDGQRATLTNLGGKGSQR